MSSSSSTSGIEVSSSGVEASRRSVHMTSPLPVSLVSVTDLGHWTTSTRCHFITLHAYACFVTIDHVDIHAFWFVVPPVQKSLGDSTSMSAEEKRKWLMSAPTILPVKDYEVTWCIVSSIIIDHYYYSQSLDYDIPDNVPLRQQVESYSKFVSDR